MSNEQWLADRAKGIGGSDWQHVLGIAPYGCARRLHYSKLRVPADYPEEETGPMKRGHKMEPLVVAEFEEQSGRSVWYPPQRSNAAALFDAAFGLAKKVGKAARPDWWVGTPDGVLLPSEDEKKPGIFEAKTKGPFPFMKVLKEGVSEGELAQRQHYLGLSGFGWGVSAYLEPVSWQLLAVPFERDAKMLRFMLEAGEQFWRRHVVEGKAPAALEPDAQQCRSCPWLPTCQGVLEWQGEADDGKDYQPTTEPQIDKLVAQRVEVAKVKKDAEDMLNDINGQLVHLGGPGTKWLTADGHKLRVSDGKFKRIDQKAFEARYPRLAERVKEKFTAVKQGTPSIYVYPRKEK